MADCKNIEYVNYEELRCSILPCYVFGEGYKEEKYWVDLQNCLYFLFDNDKFMNTKHWIITPHKPTGTVIKEDSDPDLIRWFVIMADNHADVGKEWDFDKHCPKDNVMLLENESTGGDK